MLQLKQILNQKKSRMQNLKHKSCSLLIILLALFSCDNETIYDQYQSIDNASWEKSKTYYFTFMIDDISVPYNLFFEVRNNNLYPYQNLWLFCNQEQPIGQLKRDTIECMLADDYGKWYGRGISLFQFSSPILSHYKFPYAGQYTFSFKHGMRDSLLTGIQEIGFRVDKAE
jgi:gliding motility-associated lipoprotein GldH